MDDAASCRSGMSEQEQDDRRKQIREIMTDTRLSQKEKSLTIQSLMDGRRRSSITRSSFCSSVGSYDPNDDSHTGADGTTRYVTSMAQAAAIAAQYYTSESSDEDDSMSDVDKDNIEGGADRVEFEYNKDNNFLLGRAVAIPQLSGSNDDRSVASSVVSHDSNSQNSSNYEYGSRRNSLNAGTRRNSLNAGTRRNSLQQKQQLLTNNNNNNNSSSLNISMPQSYRQFHGRSMSLQDWADTDQTKVAVAAAAANNVFSLPNPKMVSRIMEKSRPACTHYERNCTIISPCCGLAFGCRICHDECPVLPPPLVSRRKSITNCTAAAATKSIEDTTLLTDHQHEHHITGQQQQQHAPRSPVKERRRLSMPLEFHDDVPEEETHHLINRFEIREVICRECYERQSSKTNYCIKCGIKFGEYHCNICNLWMSAQELPYHCDACGFCRVGGRDNFTHCDECGMCIDSQLFDDHNCKSGKYMSNCPICQEDLFSSRFASHEMPCGHAIHWHCFKELTSYDTRCPVCKKTAESPEQMQATWSAIAMGIALQPVPPEMSRVVNIICNDCERSDTDRRWHFLGVRCLNCYSFNTVVENIVLQGQDAADFLEEQEARHGINEFPSGYINDVNDSDEDEDMDEGN